MTARDEARAAMSAVYLVTDEHVARDIARIIGSLCDELDATERGVRWEDVDKSTVTAIEFAGEEDEFGELNGGIGEVYNKKVYMLTGAAFRVDFPDLEAAETYFRRHPAWFRDGTGWHKVADR